MEQTTQESSEGSEPGHRSGSGSTSLWEHLQHDDQRKVVNPGERSPQDADDDPDGAHEPARRPPGPE
jgi:hypothetical protein